MPTLTLQAMAGQFVQLVASGESGRGALRLLLAPEPALRLAARLVKAAVAERRARWTRHRAAPLAAAE